MSRDINTTVRYLLTQNTTFLVALNRAFDPFVAVNRNFAEATAPGGTALRGSVRNQLADLVVEQALLNE